MIRSMTDEQMQERYGYDKEPYYLIEDGTRYSVAAVERSRLAGEGYGGTLYNLAVYAPRPECIPSPDPEPFVHDHPETGAAPCAINGHRHATAYPYDGYEPRPWGTFTPDPEFVRTEANPILATYRDVDNDPSWTLALRKALDDAWDAATPKDHLDARQVLYRLYRVREARE